MRPAKRSAGRGGRDRVSSLGGRTAHLQPVPAARRHGLGLARRAAAHRGDGFRLGLRQPVPRDRRLGQPLRDQGPVPPRSALPRRRWRATTTARSAAFAEDAAVARPEGDDRPRHQSHGKGRAARRGAPRRLRSRRNGRAREPLRGRSGRSLDVDGVGRPGGTRLPRRAVRAANSCSGTGTAMSRGLQALGVRGFRCDAAYKVPPEVWRASDRPPPRRATAAALFAAETLGCTFDETAGDGRRRLRLPVQQLRLVGSERALGARDHTRRCALSRPRSPSRRTTTCRASRADRRRRSGADRGARSRRATRWPPSSPPAC